MTNFHYLIHPHQWRAHTENFLLCYCNFTCPTANLPCPAQFLSATRNWTAISFEHCSGEPVVQHLAGSYGKNSWLLRSCYGDGSGGRCTTSLGCRMDGPARLEGCFIHFNLPWRNHFQEEGFLTACAISLLRKDRKCKYIAILHVLPNINLAWQGLQGSW